MSHFLTSGNCQIMQKNKMENLKCESFTLAIKLASSSQSSVRHFIPKMSIPQPSFPPQIQKAAQNIL